MANYPSPPDQRFAYHRDGSAAFFIDQNNVITSFSLAQRQSANDESDSTFFQIQGNNNNITWYEGVIFPELRNLSGYFFATVNNRNGSQAINAPHIQTSVNTTNGFDGTWVDQGLATIQTATQPFYRSQIQALAVNGIVGVRFQLPTGTADFVNFESMHLYGNVPDANSPDRLKITDNLGNTLTGAYLDYGDIGRSSTTTKIVRVKNLSLTKTAKAISLSFEALTDANPSLIGQFQLSSDNVNFTNTLAIGDLVAGGLSGNIYIRDTVSATAAFSVWAVDLIATATGGFV